MDTCVLVIDDDTEGDPYNKADASNESLRTATPQSFQTFGPDSPRNDVDHLHIPDATRPSLDSYQSSSPSTAPPTTPTHLDGSELILGKTSPQASPTLPTSNETQEKTGTLRRTNPNKRKPRPMLGVSTFASSASPGTIIEPSPLSPVIASPRSNRTRGGDPPQTPSIAYIPSPPTSHSLDAMAEPLSPDVTLDLPTSQYVFMPSQESSTSQDLVSPFGTTFIPEKKDASGPAGTKLQYKPRRRVPTPKHRSTMVDRTAMGTSTDNHAPGSFWLTRTTADVMAARNAASLSQEQGRALEDHGNGHDMDKGRRPSFSRWSFSNQDGDGIGKGVMKRLSRLRSSTDLRPSVKSVVQPLPTQEVPDLRGYASDDVPNAQGRRRSSGVISARLSRILPFPGRRQSIQQQYTNGYAAEQAQLDKEEEAHAQAHLWAAALSHSSVPLGPRTTRLSGAGSSRGGGSGSADGTHRHSTITVRSSDGWFSTVPASSVSPPGNPSPISTSFPMGIGHDLSRQNSPALGNPSRTSLSPTTATAPPFSHHSASDPTTPTLATLSAAGVANIKDGSTSRRHSEQQSAVTVADLLKPPTSSQRSSLTAGSTPKPRPQSLQHSGRPIIPEAQPAATTKVDLLNGIQLGPDSVRLLDVETAAAIRRSIDFEDRVRKGENVLRRALYGSESGSTAKTLSTSSRSSSFSAVPTAGSASPGGRGRVRGHAGKGMERSDSLGSGVGVYSVPTTPSSAPAHRSGSVDRARVMANGLATGGGVFLPSAGTNSAVGRSPRWPSAKRDGSFHSGSSSGVSTPYHHYAQDTVGYGTMRTASGTLSRESSTLREDQEETFGAAEFGESPGGAGGKNVQGVQSGHSTPSPTLARRVGRRISRIFVGKNASIS